VSEVTSSDLASQLSNALTSTKQNASSAVTYLKQQWTNHESQPEQYVEAEALDMYYITPRIIAMPFPRQDTLLTDTPLEKSIVSKFSNILSESVAQKLSRHLNKYHSHHYMIWNLSEVSYDSNLLTLFSDQVIEIKFPGYPAPPLQQLFQLLTSIDSWLKAHDANIAAIHCQTGKGRTVTAISSYLAWNGYKTNPAEALQYTCEKKMHGTIKTLTIPSQTRYLAYLSKILIDRQLPKTRPVIIERIIFHGIPYFEVAPHFGEEGEGEEKKKKKKNQQILLPILMFKPKNKTLLLQMIILFNNHNYHQQT